MKTRIAANLAFAIIVSIILLTIFRCADSPTSMSTTGADVGDGGGALFPPQGSPPPPSVDGGHLNVRVARLGERFNAFVSNPDGPRSHVHLCIYECFGDCKTVTQELYRDQRKTLEAGEGKSFRSDLPCEWQWDVLFESDPRETMPVSCPETYDYGEDFPGLEVIAAGLGKRDCKPTTTTTIPERERWCDAERLCVEWGYPTREPVCLIWQTTETQILGTFPGPGDDCPPSYAGACDGRSEGVECPE